MAAERKLHENTRRAIAAFKDAIVAEEVAERANQALNRLVVHVPADEMGEYVARTEGFR